MMQILSRTPLHMAGMGTVRIAGSHKHLNAGDFRQLFHDFWLVSVTSGRWRTNTTLTPE
jgi:hypothetical protein